MRTTGVSGRLAAVMFLMSGLLVFAQAPAPAPQAGAPPAQAGQPPPPKERPLPQFEDQKDMTAEQAAAILQAVENLERQQRREGDNLRDVRHTHGKAGKHHASKLRT